MTISTRNRLLAAATVVAAAGAVSLSAAPALATTPASDHCTDYKKVGSTKYELRVCGDLTTNKKSDHILESIFIKNTGHQNDKLAGGYGVSWGQAGNGTGFDNVKVGPGKTKAITDKFEVGTGKYTITASLTVGKATATVRTSFKK